MKLYKGYFTLQGGDLDDCGLEFFYDATLAGLYRKILYRITTHPNLTPFLEYWDITFDNASAYIESLESGEMGEGISCGGVPVNTVEGMSELLDDLEDSQDSGLQFYAGLVNKNAPPEESLFDAEEHYSLIALRNEGDSISTEMVYRFFCGSSEKEVSDLFMAWLGSLMNETRYPEQLAELIAVVCNVVTPREEKLSIKHTIHKGITPPDLNKIR